MYFLQLNTFSQSLKSPENIFPTKILGDLTKYTQDLFAIQQ